MEMVCEDVNWIQLAQDRNQCPATMTTGQKLRVYKIRDSYFAEGLCSIELVNYI
jgi:hypothetical protein